MMRTIDALRRDGVCFQSLTEYFGSESAHGCFALKLHRTVVEYFLDLNRERTMEGLKAALARGQRAADARSSPTKTRLSRAPC